MDAVEKELSGGVMLFSYPPQKLLEQIRQIIREEQSEKQSVNLHPPNGLSNKPIYTLAEIRVLFSISKPTVYKWIQAGKLHPVKIRARVYFKGEDVDKMLKEV